MSGTGAGERLPARWIDGWAAARRRALAIVTHPIFLWVLAGTVIRLLLAPFTSWTGDVLPYYFATRDLALYGSPYATLQFSYPPLFAFIAFPLDFLAMALGSPVAQYVPAMVPVARTTNVVAPIVTSPVFNLAAKAPMIVADLIVGWLLYATLEPFSARSAKRAFLLWYLNPLVILVSSVQGQFDALPALFVLAASIALIERRGCVAGLALAAAIALKAYAVFLLPLFGALLLADLVPWTRSLARAVRHILDGSTARRVGVFLGATAAGLLLFFLPSAGLGLTAITRRTAALQPGGFSGVALFFMFAGNGALTSLNYGTLPNLVSLALLVATGVLAITIAVRAFPHLRGPTALDSFLVLSQGTVLVLVAVFLLSPLVNPQYLLWILPSLILLSSRWRTFEWSALLLSTAGFVFEVGLLGPAAYLYPLAVYTGTVSVGTLNGAILGYWSLHGLFSPILWKDVTNVAMLVGVAELAWIALRSARLTRNRGRR